MIEPATTELPRGSEQTYVIGSTAPGVGDQSTTSSYEPGDQDRLNKRLMAMARAAVTHANSSDLGARKAAMARSNQAMRGQHAEGSKYKHKNYSSRSKLFIPKTRTAVKSKMVAARAALFSTEKAVFISPADDTDERQQASAELNTELLNYRLDRSTGKKGGVNWMKLAMGAAYDACVAGICVTKQTWSFAETLKEAEEDFDPMDPSLDPDVLGMNGRPKRRTVTRDRPEILHIEPENVIVDMAAPWWDVVQEGSFFIVRHPMKVGDVKAMMKPGAQHMGGGPWYEIPEKVMSNAVADNSVNVRSSRTGGQDRYARTAQPSVNEFDIVWVHENFMKVDSCDYHFWSLGTKQLLSDPGEVGTRGHYPAHQGERPYVMGVGAIEPHVALPMSHVEAWRPMQDEINDTRNLRLDVMKQAIAPMTVYKQGTNIDLRAVRERGPDATIGVQNMDDIRFERISGPDASAFAETDRMNGEFDELAGAFATSTVQSSRAAGETVGGMQLVNSSANSVQEFDLCVFLETWAEPVIRHFVWLEQYYETDETLMALMAKKANLYERFGQDVALDALLEQQLTIKVNIGPGAGDPTQKLQRINAAIDMCLKIAPTVQGQVQPKAEELFGEIWAGTGVSADRVFEFKSIEEAEAKMQEMQEQAAQAQQQPDPNAGRAEAEQAKLEYQSQADQAKMQYQAQADQSKLQAADQANAAKLQLESEKSQVELQISREKNALELQKLEFERDKLAREIETANMEIALKAQTHERDFALKKQQADHAAVGQAFDMTHRVRDQQHQQQGAERDFHLRAVDSAANFMPEEEPPAPEPTLADQGNAAMSAAMEAVGEGLQKLAESQTQIAEMLAAMMAQQQQARRVVRDGMGRTIPVVSSTGNPQ